MYRHEYYDREGNLILVEDTREFSQCLEAKIAELKASCTEAILAVAPEYKQRNALLGLIPDAEVEQMRLDIKECREKYERLKMSALAVVPTGDSLVDNHAIDCIIWE